MADRKWSVKYVSDSSGVSRLTIYAFMRGENPPSPDTQRGLARALEVGADWYDRLLAGEPPVEASSSPGVEERIEALELEMAALRLWREEAMLMVDSRQAEMDAVRARVSALEASQRLAG